MGDKTPSPKHVKTTPCQGSPKLIQVLKPGTPMSGRALPGSAASTPVICPSMSTPYIGTAPFSLSSPATPLLGSRSTLDPTGNTDSALLPSGMSYNVDTGSYVSETNSTLDPTCRICQLPNADFEILISPCRCSGTLKFVHKACLKKWITTKKSRKPPKCELCQYQYHRHKKFKCHHWRFPRVSKQDRVLHVIFIINLLIMIGCAIATVMCFLSDKGQISKFPKNKVELTTEEIITLSCGVLFFVSFFIAMSVQIKAKHTIYQLFVKFVMHNMEWEIDDYDKAKDSMYIKDIYKGGPACV